MLGRKVSAGLLLVFAGPTALAIAHGAVLESPPHGAVLKSTQSAVAAGGILTVNGSDFDEGTYALRLIGALVEFDLRQVTPNEEGTFALELEIPRAVRAGQYKLTAVASDGHAAASLDLTILEGSVTNEPEAGRDLADEPEAGHGATSGEMARAEDLPIERSRGGAEWGLIGLLIGLAGGLGVSMIRRA